MQILRHPLFDLSYSKKVSRMSVRTIFIFAENGQVFSWGDGRKGQLGLGGEKKDSREPVSGEFDYWRKLESGEMFPEK